MSLRQAIALFIRPWTSGNVTFKEWELACDVIEEAIRRDRADRSDRG